MDRDERTSRRLTQLLRHGAVREGLPIRADGYMALDVLLAHHSLAGVTEADVVRVVAVNDKQRLALTTDAHGHRWIKANQGHTIPVVTELELTPITDPAEALVVVHGTSLEGWRRITASGGVHRMGRNHIHWAAGVPGQGGGSSVISGMRASSEVLLYLDVAAALAGGLALARSPNGVILTSGLDGWVPLRFLARVVDRHGTELPFDRATPLGPPPRQPEPQSVRAAGRAPRRPAPGPTTASHDP